MTRFMRLATHLSAIVVVMAVAACATQRTPAETSALEQKSIAFLEPGKTTREEVLINLGVPTAVFEKERIFTYRMVLHDREGLIVVAHGLPGPRYGLPGFGNYHLIVVFDQGDAVTRYRVLKPGHYRDPVKHVQGKGRPATN